MMKGAFLIGKLFGVPIKIHWSFWLLGLYIFSIGWYKSVEINQLLVHFAFVIAVFFCVILHELGHALVARYFKIQTTEIVVLPIGGVAIFGNGWITAPQEFLIAFAGPLTNFVIAFLIWFGLYLFTPLHFQYIGISNQILDVSISFSERLMWINLIIGGFNLIPTLPLDGGVMFRSLLTQIFNRYLANKIQFIFSMCIALGFVIYSYYFHAVEYLIFSWLIYFSARGKKE